MSAFLGLLPYVKPITGKQCNQIILRKTPLIRFPFLLTSLPQNSDKFIAISQAALIHRSNCFLHRTNRMASYYVYGHSKVLVPSQPVTERSMLHSDNALFLSYCTVHHMVTRWRS